MILQKLTKRSITVVGLSASSLALFASSAMAQSTVWDATSQFSAPTQPASWAYLQRTGAGCVTPGSVLPAGYSPAPGLVGYIAGPIPLVAKNTNTTQTAFSSVKVDAGKLWMHPGTKGECAVVRFKAPSAGTYVVEVTMKAIDVASPNVVRGYVFGSNAPAVAVGGLETLNAGGAYGTTKSFTRTVSVLGANRYIDFAIDDGANADPLGPFRFDSTQVELRICRIGGPGMGGVMGGDIKRCDRPR